MDESNLAELRALRAVPNLTLKKNSGGYPASNIGRIVLAIESGHVRRILRHPLLGQRGEHPLALPHGLL